jgi:hypothetical protein
MRLAPTTRDANAIKQSDLGEAPVTYDTPSLRQRRTLAAAFAACALATLTLLASHPTSGAHNFAEFIQYESQHQFMDALVHGGFIVTLGALLVCFILLSRLLGGANPAVVSALVAFCIGCGALMASMLLDGFVTPAIATRFSDIGKADNLVAARTLLVFCGTAIRFLMPMGMLFQAVALFAWSSIIVRGGGLCRSVGVFGLAAALILIVGLFLAPARIGEHVLLGGIVLQTAWYIALAGLLAHRESFPTLPG